MDQVVVAEKLASLVDHIDWVEQSIPDDHVGLLENRYVRESVVLNIILAVQDCVDIAMHAISKAGIERPSKMRDAFDSLRRMGAISDTTAETLKQATGIRNVATHRYATLDMRILHALCTHHLDEFRSFVDQIGQYAGIADNPRPPADETPPSANVR